LKIEQVLDKELVKLTVKMGDQLKGGLDIFSGPTAKHASPYRPSPWTDYYESLQRKQEKNDDDDERNRIAYTRAISSSSSSSSNRSVASSSQTSNNASPPPSSSSSSSADEEEETFSSRSSNTHYVRRLMKREEDLASMSPEDVVKYENTTRQLNLIVKELSRPGAQHLFLPIM
jgi:hypothetical protein